MNSVYRWNLPYMKQVFSRVFLILLIFFIAVALGIFFRRSKNPLNALVKVEISSYYVLYLADGDSLCFSEASLLDRKTMRMDTLPHLRVISFDANSSLLKSTHYGFCIARDGSVQVAIPKTEDTLRGENFKQAIMRTWERLGETNRTARRHLNELEYYRRTHTVIDDGYNEVMRYAEMKKRELANAESVYHRLTSALQLRNLSAIKRSRILVNGLPYICIKQKAGLAILKPNANITSLRLIDGKDQSLLLQPQPIGDSHSFLDSTHTYYQLQIDSLGFRGTSLTKDGIYYEGSFDSLYRKNGFGFQIDEHFVKCGVWKKNQFQGERMLYTSERVYGIDISRYQHEIGKRKYPIRWDKLRIRHLGTLSNKRIHGEVNYPVSFLFIKATEGTSVRNRYFDADLKAARKYRFPVAAYHFFSPKPNGVAQAKYFLRYAKSNWATLPPMLDVEPSHAEIERMGGIDILFREVLMWLKIVEQQTGRRPLLYISQSFVNRYMGDAPDALKEYPIWIARYGEFKPYIKLLLWQLSPDGRVEGIRGDVDINVFNGSKAEFNRWIESSNRKM